MDNYTPIRQPLTPLHPNITPAALKHVLTKKKAKVNGAKGTPLGAKKPYSPLVDLDIIVIDDAGRRLSQERRVSRTNVQVNPVTTMPTRRGSKVAAKILSVVATSDSEEEEYTVKPMKRPAGRKNVIVISSDESEPEVVSEHLDDIPLAQLQSTPPKPSNLPRKLSKLQVEVIVPPASYRIPTTKTKLPSPPPVQPQPLPSIYLPLAPPPLPVTKPRQLTPIRRNGSRSLYQAPYPPSPSTPTDLDLSLDFSQLDITPSPQLNNSASSPPDYLLPLLTECSQDNPYEFSAFIETFPFDPIVQPADAAATDIKFHKIGEASYSEVFGIGDVVLKVIPLRDEEAKAVYNDVDTPAPSDAKDVLKEMIVTRAIGEVCDGFVKLLRTYIVRGRYPSLLLDLWDEYNERKGSESIRPDTFSLSQTYAIIVLPNGGPDLEAFTFTHTAKLGWHQACSLFWQVAMALSQAEELVNFEHRDLHWGQILVKTVPIPKTKRLTKMPMDDIRFGLKATIIDLGLSRMDANESKTYWTHFDEEIFEGEGDYQFDVYRMMKGYNLNSWQKYRPFTNVMWLHYLVLKLLYSKRLKPPAPSRRTTSVASRSALGGYEEKECYDCLLEMEEVLAKCIKTTKKKQPSTVRKGGRKTQAVVSTEPERFIFENAGCVINYGKSKGWLK
ncbi:hypothetical protein SERLA73DRAFT_86185 [Serpula lacrymans var. lacrymans S7.3]|uniref:non-specific serine/threonine protein kinase n=2 Tax=Serpula lacrymans var. lacrymans TaxID=341189 RepID=F8PPH2_SERL3|nr:hypothetical protein SERLA73DRAFT_86185 [Serpula lacrymans var. lacrymans S7.3]